MDQLHPELPWKHSPANAAIYKGSISTSDPNDFHPIHSYLGQTPFMLYHEGMRASCFYGAFFHAGGGKQTRMEEGGRFKAGIHFNENKNQLFKYEMSGWLTLHPESGEIHFHLCSALVSGSWHITLTNLRWNYQICSLLLALI